ncbi:MAG: DUF1664 domain-containing protein [Candidatus Pacebacteria bacterium]|jgi:low affinity Fe/Cu permease|nr:DUF1664 domain-containing protein [Candidatus Paceibacterota bacterium]
MKNKNNIQRALKKRRKKTLAGIEDISKRITSWIGSPTSVIVHTLLFASAFVFSAFGYPLATVLLVLTTIVSLEAIYLSIFIQMTVNRNSSQLDEVAEDIEEIQEDVDEIQEDVEGIEKDVDEIQKDVDELEEEIERDEAEEKIRDKELLEKIEGSLKNLMEEITALKKKK